MRLVYLNVKPQKADEQNPDSWQNIEQLGLSVAATYNAVTKIYRIYEEKDVKKLIRTLLDSDLVVTFNGQFDLKVLNGYANQDLLTDLKSFSMLENIEGDLWQRLSLANLAKQNLNRYQTTTVMHQIELYKRELMGILRNAVQYDIKSIVALFKLGCKRKFLHYWCPDVWTQKSFRRDSWASTCQKLTFTVTNYRR